MTSSHSLLDEDQALCKGYHSDLWFPPVFPQDRTGSKHDYYEIAKMVCEHCPIKDGCLERGFVVDEEVGERQGVWGGWSPLDRKIGGGDTLPIRQMSKSDIPKVIPMQDDSRADIPSIQRSIRRHSWWRT